jgi:hypothetical protein
MAVVMHPIDATVTKINALSPYFQLSAGAPIDASWTRADALLGDPDRVATTVGRLHAKRGYVTPRDLATSFYDGYQWYVGAAAISGFFADARVPDISTDNVALKIDDEGWVVGIALIDARFACLPDDPAAAHPDARIFADRAALREHAARSIYAHSNRLAALLIDVAGVNEYSLRLASVNSIATLAIWILQQAKQPALAETEAHAFAAALPFPAKARLFEVECDGERAVYVNGSVCCHWYLDPENTERSYCGNCPKVPLKKRIEVLRDRLREERREKTGEVG